jgi:hypothetical protein
MRDGFAAAASLNKAAAVQDQSVRRRSYVSLDTPTESRSTPTAWQLVVRRTLRELGHTRLTFEQVRQSRVPAIFQKYGERVLFLDDRVFLFDEDSGLGPEGGPTVIDASALEDVGIEYGWRHASDCRCLFCGATEKQD